MLLILPHPALLLSHPPLSRRFVRPVLRTWPNTNNTELLLGWRPRGNDCEMFHCGNTHRHNTERWIYSKQTEAKRDEIIKVLLRTFELNMKHQCTGQKKTTNLIHAKYVIVWFMQNWYIWNSSEKSEELHLTGDITLALLSPLMLHFCFEFCTMFETESHVSGETIHPTEALFPLRKAAEATLRYTPFKCWLMVFGPMNSQTRKTQKAEKAQRYGHGDSAVCRSSEKCEVGPGFLSVN